MIKNIPWWSPQITKQEHTLVNDVLNSNYVNEGEVTTEFEQEVARLLDVKHAIATTSGTAAIFLALAGVGVGPGDEVIVPDVTFIATANSVMLTGAKPVLVDIDPLTLNMDLESMSMAITDRTKAIVPVHVSGRSANLMAIKEIAQSHGIAVVEDAAEAFMSALDGKYLGTIGNVGCLSFSPNKVITTGQGGMALTNDDVLHVRLRELKDHGRPIRGTGGADIHHSVGYNFKLTNLQSAVGLGQLTALHQRLERQKQIYRIYAENLRGLPGITLPGFHLETGEVPLWTDAIVERRNELDQYLQQRGAHCRRFWFPIHTQAHYRLSDNKFPNSTKVMPQAIWLPSAFTLSDDDIMTVCSWIREFVGI